MYKIRFFFNMCILFLAPLFWTKFYSNFVLKKTSIFKAITTYVVWNGKYFCLWKKLEVFIFAPFIGCSDSLKNYIIISISSDLRGIKDKRRERNRNGNKKTQIMPKKLNIWELRLQLNNCHILVVISIKNYKECSWNGICK